MFHCSNHYNIITDIILFFPLYKVHRLTINFFVISLYNSLYNTVI